MRRRTVLASGASIASGAGCSELVPTTADKGTPPKNSPSPSPTEEAPKRVPMGAHVEFTDGSMMRLSQPSVQGSVVADGHAFDRIARDEGIQHVVVNVRSRGLDDVEKSRFGVERNGERVLPPRRPLPVVRVLDDCSTACISVPIRTESSERGAVVYRALEFPTGVWELPDHVVEQFGAKVTVELKKATIRDVNGDVGIRFTVRNDNDRDARFIALVAPDWVADVRDPVGFMVPGGTEVSETVVPPEIQQLAPSEATIKTSISGDTRYIRVGGNE